MSKSFLPLGWYSWANPCGVLTSPSSVFWERIFPPFACERGPASVCVPLCPLLFQPPRCGGGGWRTWVVQAVVPGPPPQPSWEGSPVSRTLKKCGLVLPRRIPSGPDTEAAESADAGRSLRVGLCSCRPGISGRAARVGGLGSPALLRSEQIFY